MTSPISTTGRCLNFPVKTNNDKYLKSVWFKDYPYLQFSSDDPNQKETAHKVVLQPDGSPNWRQSPNWIWGDSSHESGNETLFRPVRLSDGRIALPSAANDNFLRRLTTEWKTD
ncbi:hypothetical protein C2S52_016221 [Perilla frutescens var. hirtella]|nr:hypothetical protein C2S52_016221 [Perilla frutescens var. hirtella]